MIEVFDKTRRRVAILENAYAASESQKINSVWYFYFSLPYGDSKNEYCKPFYYVRPDGGELYRIMPETLSVSESGGISYQCEHVLATLIDNVLFGYHVVGNLGVYTADVIRYILDHQLVKNWVLDECDFRNQFEYGWEQESLLSALFSVLSPLSSPMIVTDTTVYPWRLSLKKLVTTGRPEMYVRRRYNMTSYTRGRDPQNIVTRLYPLGYGEGINQLNIKGVNDGVPYIQSPKEITDKYGIIERVWIDRRYEDAASLKAAAEIMLSELQEPLVSYSVGFHELTASDYDKAAIGKRVRIIFPEVGDSVDTYITELTRKRDDLKESTITVANRETSIAASLADMADRQRIEQTYAQGATQIYSQALQANSAPDSGATMDFFLPSEMRIVNKVLVKVRMKKFRAYSKATEAAESKTITSSTSDEDTRTSSSGGRTTATTTSGGGTYTSTTYEAKKTLTATAVILSAENIYPTEAAMYNAAKHNHGIPDRVKLAVYGGKDANGNVIADGYATFIESGAHSHGEHDHEITIPRHNHEVEIDDHSHKVTIPAHTHDITIPGHSHKVTIPGHEHKITPGIFEYGNPQNFSLYVNGEKKADFAGRNAELDITAFLVGSDNMIPRGSWLSLEVRPDDLAYLRIKSDAEIGLTGDLVTFTQTQEDKVSVYEVIVGDLLREESGDGLFYRWYEVESVLVETDHTPQLAAEVEDMAQATVAASIVFTVMAETGQIDDTTAAENASQFAEWAYPVAYKAGAIRLHAGRLYRCVQDHTSQENWTPDAAASLWAEIADPSEEWPKWAQPIGAHDAYSAGAKVSHSEKKWTSDLDNNVWEPGVYGWTEVKDLDVMTVAELKEYASENGIALTGLTLKADILAAIKTSEGVTA